MSKQLFLIWIGNMLCICLTGRPIFLSIAQLLRNIELCNSGNCLELFDKCNLIEYNLSCSYARLLCASMEFHDKWKCNVRTLLMKSISESFRTKSPRIKDGCSSCLSTTLRELFAIFGQSTTLIHELSQLLQNCIEQIREAQWSFWHSGFEALWEQTQLRDFDISLQFRQQIIFRVFFAARSCYESHRFSKGHLLPSIAVNTIWLI